MVGINRCYFNVQNMIICTNINFLCVGISFDSLFMDAANLLTCLSAAFIMDRFPNP